MGSQSKSAGFPNINHHRWGIQTKTLELGIYGTVVAMAIGYNW
jgi:hypothetical protein